MVKLKNLHELSKRATQSQAGQKFLSVSPDDVVSKKQVRKKFRNIGELAETMKVEGLQSPIIVSPKNSEGKYVIQKGERRWRAAKMAGLELIDILINEKPLSEVDETAGELIENIQRDDLDPMEIAEALSVFQREGWKQKEIAERIGKSTIYVSTHLSLLKLPACVLELYEKEILRDTEGLNNLRLLYELNPENCQTICAMALDSGMSRKQSRDLLNAEKEIKSGNSSKSPESSGSAVTAGLNTGTESTSSGSASYGAHEADAFLRDAQGASGEEDEQGKGQGAETSVPGGSQASKPKAEPKNQDAMPPLPKDKDWKYVEAKELIIMVNVPGEKTVKKGILMLDRACLNPQEVWVKVLEGSKDKEIKVLASEIDLVSVGA